jgi:hypothetical protein
LFLLAVPISFVSSCYCWKPSCHPKCNVLSCSNHLVSLHLWSMLHCAWEFLYAVLDWIVCFVCFDWSVYCSSVLCLFCLLCSLFSVWVLSFVFCFLLGFLVVFSLWIWLLGSLFLVWRMVWACLFLWYLASCLLCGLSSCLSRHVFLLSLHISYVRSVTMFFVLCVMLCFTQLCDMRCVAFIQWEFTLNAVRKRCTSMGFQLM